jgi:hypothetical protein
MIYTITGEWCQAHVHSIYLVVYRPTARWRTTTITGCICRSATLQEINDSIIRRFGSEIRVPKARIALTRESAWDPRVQIGIVPNRDADTVLDSQACADRVDIIGGLLSIAGSCGREGAETDVDFGIGNLDAEGGEALEVGCLAGEVWGLADDEVALETDAVDLDATGFEGLHDLLCGGCLGAGVLDVVVIVV